MDTNYERSNDETSSALITRTIVRSSGNRTLARSLRVFLECETRPRSLVYLTSCNTEAKVLGSPQKRTVLIATVDRLNRSMSVFGIPPRANRSFYLIPLRSRWITTRDENPQPLASSCAAVIIEESFPVRDNIDFVKIINEIRPVNRNNRIFQPGKNCSNELCNELLLAYTIHPRYLY